MMQADGARQRDHHRTARARPVHGGTRAAWVQHLRPHRARGRGHHATPEPGLARSRVLATIQIPGVLTAWPPIGSENNPEAAGYEQFSRYRSSCSPSSI
jgi:hypothetical protein